MNINDVHLGFRNGVAVIGEDPARKIWGDAVVDRASEAPVTPPDSSGGGGGWQHPGAGCCIVGHLNWTAAEMRGLNPMELGIHAWPAYETAWKETKIAVPGAPNEVTIETTIGPIVIDSAGFVEEMAVTHDQLERDDRYDDPASYFNGGHARRVLARTSRTASLFRKVVRRAEPTPAPEPIVEQAAPVELEPVAKPVPVPVMAH